jgi:hypothetical protein
MTSLGWRPADVLIPSAYNAIVCAPFWVHRQSVPTVLRSSPSSRIPPAGSPSLKYSFLVGRLAVALAAYFSQLMTCCFHRCWLGARRFACACVITDLQESVPVEVVHQSVVTLLFCRVQLCPCLCLLLSGFCVFAAYCFRVAFFLSSTK